MLVEATHLSDSGETETMALSRLVTLYGLDRPTVAAVKRRLGAGLCMVVHIHGIGDVLLSAPIAIWPSTGELALLPNG